MKKSLLAAAMLAAAGSVSAAPFYLDIGTNYDFPIVAPNKDKVTDTSTSIKNEFTLTYDSNSTVFDIDANGIDAGDGVSTDAGLIVGGFNLTGLATNQINGFLPNEVFGSNSNNGYGDDWFISFSADNLTGIVAGVLGGVPLFSYGPGLLELFVTFNGTTFNNFMDIKIAGGMTDGVGTSLVGTADFTTVDAGYNDLFHSASYSCLGSDSYFDIWSNCGEGAGEALSINFVSHFDTGIFVSDFTNNGNDTFSVTSNHDGSGTFDVPEPGTLALMGGSLLMLAGMSRRKKA